MITSTFVFVCNDNDLIAKTKQSFVEFFGMRMIADVCKDSPIMKMNTIVEAFDMNNVNSFIPENMTVLVIKAESDFDIRSLNYTYLKL